MKEENIYVAIAKYTFAVVGGGAAAGALVVGTYKGVKSLVSMITGPSKPKDADSN